MKIFTILGFLAIFFLTISSEANAQNALFVKIPTSIENFSNSDVAWGDYDKDGDLDVLITGELSGGARATKIYQNNGGIFTEVADVEGGASGSVEWGDFDNDNDLDFVVTGQNQATKPITIIYRNDAGTFNDIGAGLTGVMNSSASWGDYDKDGDLDLIIAGTDSNFTPITKLYQNDGGSFIEVSHNFQNVYSSSLSWGDYDNDGDLDLLLTGYTQGFGDISVVYRNDDTTFVDISAPLNAISNGEAAWGDYDKDGDLDILIVGDGCGDGCESAAIYRNDGNTFVNILATLGIGTTNSSATWGDIDNDGDLDVLYTGYQNGQYKADIFRNDVGNFSYLTSLSIGITDGAAVFGDYDKDGKLDILLTGNDISFQPVTALFKNVIPFVEIPTALKNISNGSVAWGDYDKDGDLDVLLSGTPNGGGANNAGLTQISTIYRNDNGIFVDLNAGLQGVSLGSAAWGDYDNDGDLDIVLTGVITGEGTIPFSEVYRNDAGNFVATSAGLTGVYYSAVAWGDYDNDGDLDILLAGDTNSLSITKIYRNDSGVFSVDTLATALPGVYDGSVAWGDYDKDGDLDILLTGSTCGLDCPPYISNIYRNDGGGVFTDIDAGLTGVYRSSAVWGDMNNDGYLDIVLSGAIGGGKTLKIYENNGDGTFTDLNPPNLTPFSRTSLALGDFDNDGDLDILGAGVIDNTTSATIVYRNDGGGLFTKADSILIGVADASVAWGDFDNDGKLDILATGYNIQSTLPYTLLYRNLSPTTNTQPVAPSNLQSFVTGTSVNLQWNLGSDTQTPTNGLTYNIRVGTSSNGVQKVSPMANLSSGYRLVSKLGNMDHTTSWTTDNLPEGTYYWSVQAIDNAFAGSEFFTEQIFIVDTTAPGSPTITINGGATYSNSTTVSLSITAIGADSMKFSGDIVGGGIYKSFAASDTVVLTTGDGTKTVYLEVKDKSGNVAPQKNDTIVLDTTPPGSPSISINGGATYTLITNVTLTLNATNADSMKFSGDLTSGNQFIAYSTNGNVNLTGGEGNKTVYALFKDLAGNITTPVSDNIALNLTPGAPQSLVANSGDSQVTLRWRKNPESDIQRYRIYRGTSPSPVTQIDSTASGADTTIIISGLTNLTTYFFRVTAVDQINLMSLYSNEVSSIPGDVTPPAPATSLVATSSPTTDKQINLSWTASVSGDVAGYRIYRSTTTMTNPADTTGKFLVTVGVVIVYNDVTPAYGTYYYRIFAFDQAKNLSTASNQNSANSPDHLAPSAASSLSATVSTAVERRITLNWTVSASPDVAGYRIFRSGSTISDTSGYLLASVGTVNTYTDNPASFGTYFYRIYARDGSGNISATSNEVSATVAPFAPRLSAAVYQNPVLPKYIDIIVVSDLVLGSAPLVRVGFGTDTSGTPVGMSLVSGATTTFHGSYAFSQDGLHTIYTRATTVSGGTSTNTKTFTGSIAKPGLLAQLSSPDGRARLEIPGNLVREEMYLVSESEISGNETIYRFNPTKTFEEPVTVELVYEPKVGQDAGKLFVYGKTEAGNWEALRSQVYGSERKVKARSWSLGEFKLVYDATYQGTNLVPTNFALAQNFPNPFNPSTMIAYELPEDGKLLLTIYNLLGQQVRTLYNGNQLAGSYTTRWDGKNEVGQSVASGVYFYRIQSGRLVQTRKMLLLR